MCGCVKTFLCISDKFNLLADIVSSAYITIVFKANGKGKPIKGVIGN